MDDRTTSLDELTVTAERAAEWLGRPRKEKESFHKWLRRSPQNCGEVLVATATDIVLRQLFREKRIDVGQLLSECNNVITVGQAEHSLRPRPPGKRLRFIASLGVGVAAATIASIFVGPAIVRDWLHPGEYTTSVGEQRAIELPDGSVIAINAKSSVRVAFSEATRDVYLSAGQAMFTVAKDPRRPFRVHVADRASGKSTVIQALGTKFDVRVRSERVNVAVIEGVVQIRERGLDSAFAEIVQLAKVAAGESVSIESTGLITSPAPISVSDVSAWQQRRLVFTDNTLEEIVEEFERYNRAPRIQLDGDDLRNRRLSGVFDADYPEALLLYLASDETVSLDRNGDTVSIRLRSTNDQSHTSE